MNNFEVVKHIESELSMIQCRSLAEVINSAWPGSIESYYKSIFINRSNNRFIYAVWQDGKAIGTATCFNRVIKTKTGDLKVFAIAGVCVLPSLRNTGVGKSIINKIIETIPSESVTCMLQTRYDLENYFSKVGFKRAYNSFLNNPFWDDIVMYYNNLDWSDGEIDINGPGW